MIWMHSSSSLDVLEVESRWWPRFLTIRSLPSSRWWNCESLRNAFQARPHPKNPKGTTYNIKIKSPTQRWQFRTMKSQQLKCRSNFVCCNNSYFEPWGQQWPFLTKSAILNTMKISNWNYNKNANFEQRNHNNDHF